MGEQENVIPSINETEVNIDNNVVFNPNANATADSVLDSLETPLGATEGAWKQSTLPVKIGFWSKVKSLLFQEIKVDLTPKQQKVEDEINSFLFQEITFFGNKKNK